MAAGKKRVPWWLVVVPWIIFGCQGIWDLIHPDHPESGWMKLLEVLLIVHAIAIVSVVIVYGRELEDSEDGKPRLS
jgi:hypothetical protein